MVEENKNLEVQIQEKRKNHFAWRKTFLATFCCFFLAIFLFLIFEDGFFYFFATTGSFPYILITLYQASLYPFGFFLPSLFIFLLGITKRNLLLIISSFFLLVLPLLFVYVIPTISYYNTEKEWRLFLSLIEYFVFPSILFWVFYHWKKEALFFKAAGLLFTFLLISSIISRIGIAYLGTSFYPKICELATREETKNYCFEDFARETKDFVLCGRVSEGYLQYKCYKDVAKENKDVDICDKISDEWHVDQCYIGVAVVTKNESICEAISNIDRKNSCFFYVAGEKKDPTLCDKITNPTLRDNCKRQ